MRPQTDAEGSPPGGGQPADTPTVPDYDLLQRIGVGAYGEVWLARSKATGARRAAKIVWRNRFQDERPFRREFEGIQRFEQISRGHPSQLALFHIGRNDPEGYFYYVMELADDLSVSGRVESAEFPSRSNVPISPSQPEGNRPYQARTLRAELEHGRLPAALVLEIGLELTEALSHLHQHGLVHRDVKPSNVIFVIGRPKLADIGLVTDASDQCSIVGTEGYLPPEGPGTPQADIFALGKVLYEAVTGMDRREFPKLPRDLRAWPDRTEIIEFNEILFRACSQKAERRYQSCDQMQADLALLGQGKSVRQKRMLRHGSALARKVLLAAVIVGVLAGSANLLWLQWSRSRAVRLYEQALKELKSHGFDHVQRAHSNLTEAVRLDPGFVNAHFKMFENYLWFDQLPPNNNRLANLRTAAERLRALSPDSAQYHAANSQVKFDEWKFEEAIKEVMLAINIDTNFMRAHFLYGWYLELACGDPEAALEEYRKAERLDPTDTLVQHNIGFSFYHQRDFDQAIRQLTNTIKMDPDAAQVHQRLAVVYEAAGQYTNALAEYEKFDLACGWDSNRLTPWYEKQLVALHDNGVSGWQQFLLNAAKNTPNSDPYREAEINARLGKTNGVFSLLTQAYEEHNGQMIFLLIDDHWDGYRDDERFKGFLTNLGFIKLMSLPKK